MLLVRCGGETASPPSLAVLTLCESGDTPTWGHGTASGWDEHTRQRLGVGCIFDAFPLRFSSAFSQTNPRASGAV